MTTTPRPIRDLDVPLETVQQLVARQRAAARAEESAAKLRWLLAHPAPSRPATPGELKEQQHWLHDADPDSTVPVFRVNLTKRPQEKS
jgi:hypothetical protein